MSKYLDQLDKLLEDKSLSNEDIFWKFYKQYKISKSENAVRCAEFMSEHLALDYDKTGKYYEFITKFLNGEVVYNKFGKKLYWKY